MLSRKTVSLTAALAVAAVIVLVYAPRPAASQDGFGIPQEDQDNANAILGSSSAQFLSGDGLNALNALSGRIRTRLSAGSGFVHGTPPISSNRFDVMVNNPAEDTFAFFDISSQSETAVAGVLSTSNRKPPLSAGDR